MSITMEKLFNLPDLGEGLTESEILSWRVAEGDTVELNQVIAEVETAKAVVELPSPFSGVVKKLYEPVGAVVNVGKPIVSFDVDQARGVSSPEARGDGTGQEKPQPTLVGYGAPTESTGPPARRARRGVASSARDRPDDAPLHTPTAAPPARAVEVMKAENKAEAQQGIGHLRSSPPVRKLARDRGIDLGSLQGTGANGLITREDVMEALRGENPPARSPLTPDAAPGTGQGDTHTPIRGVRKATAAAMVASAFTAPNVTVFLSVDVTETMALLERLRSSKLFAGVKLTVTTLLAKIVTLSLARHRALNSHWDGENADITEFGHVNLGLAAATGRGLMVPVVHDAQRMDLAGLAAAAGELTLAAREGTITPAQLTGGTFSISNVGVFGIDAGTPILPPGQAGILAVGQVRMMPWEHQGEIALRQVMTLSLSFDHRLVDGEQGASFLAEVGGILEDPGMLMGLV